MSTFRRPIDATESLRSTRRSLGDGTVQGRSRLAMPPQGKARGTGIQRLSGVSPVEGTSTGETITVDADDVAVSTTPTVVTFTAEVGERAGFLFVPPTANVQPTFGQAYYDIQVSIDRGGYAGTLAVEILRGDEVVWGPTFDGYWANPQVPVTAKGRLVDPAISPWRVRLTGSEAGTVTRVVAQVELVDRPRLDVPVAPEEYVARVGYGLNVLTTNDGASTSLTLVPGNLTEIEVGDVLLFGVQSSRVVISGASSTPDLTIPAGLTELHRFPDGVSGGNVVMSGWWWRRATADDVDGINTYQFQAGPNGSNSIIRSTATVMVLGGLGTVGSPWGSVVTDWYAGDTSNPPGTLTVAAPGSSRTLVTSLAVRATNVFPATGFWEQTPLTSGLSSEYFWISDSIPAPTVGQFAGFDGDLGDLGGNRGSGMHRVLIAESDTGAQIKYGSSLTHAGVIAVGIDA